MSRREEYEQKAEELITPIVEANGFELVDVEYVKEGGTWYLRAYIDTLAVWALNPRSSARSRACSSMKWNGLVR